MAKTLKRSLPLIAVTLYGLGNILGAGIYVLIGKVAGTAGEGTILAFIVAMVIAGLTAFSYMELVGRYPVSASVSMYLHEAFGKRWLSVLVGLVMVAGGITSAAALAQGFAGYLHQVIAIPELVASVLLLVAIGLLAMRGIGESAIVAGLFTFLEIGGLAVIIWAGQEHITTSNAVAALHPATGLVGVLPGAFLAFYAFIGFEDMVNVAEEVKNPRRTMPLAILLSLGIATVLYLLVVLVATTAISPGELAGSEAPLSLVFDRLSTINPLYITVIGISAAINGIVVQIIMGSRILYGLAKKGWLHHELARLHETRRTPLLATGLVTISMIVATIALPLVSLAQLTSFLILGIFTMVNVALIKIKRDHPRHGGFVTVPMLIPVVGALSCSGVALYQFFNV